MGIIIIIAYLLCVGIFYNTLGDVVNFKQSETCKNCGNEQGISVNAKRIWLSIVWPIVFMPILSWFVTKQLTQNKSNHNREETNGNK